MTGNEYYIYYNNNRNITRSIHYWVIIILLIDIVVNGHIKTNTQISNTPHLSWSVFTHGFPGYEAYPGFDNIWDMMYACNSIPDGFFWNTPASIFWFHNRDKGLPTFLKLGYGVHMFKHKNGILQKPNHNRDTRVRVNTLMVSLFCVCMCDDNV